MTCDPLGSAVTMQNESISVSAEQAARKAIARAFGGALAVAPSLLFACDGAAHTVAVGLSTDPTGPSFHGGQAVFNATARASGFDPFLGFMSQRASTGAMIQRIH